MTAASRYANALFDLAAEANQQSAVATSVAALATAVGDESIASTLSNPRLTVAQRTKLAQSMGKAVSAPQVLANTLGLLAANNRLAAVPAVLAAYLAQNDKASGMTHVRIASAQALTEAQKTKLIGTIKGYTKSSDVRLEETLDPTLKGGFRAYFNGQVWDASLSGALSRLTTRLRTAIAQHQH